MTDEPPIAIGLMCKPPRPGITKSRLASRIGLHEAAQLSAAFLRDCADAVDCAGAMTPLLRMAFYRPCDAGEEIQLLLGNTWHLAFADHGDLGATMAAILRRLLIECPDGAILMGADVPLIEPRLIVEAARGLRSGTERDIVVSPTADGGYCLIGIKSIDAAAPLFDPMTWSTASVFRETLCRARRNNLRIVQTNTQRDIDDVADLVWLRDALAAAPDRAAHTQTALRALDSHLPAQCRARS